MTPIAKIRAALEMARDYITSDLASERGAFEGYEGVSRIGEIKADLANNDEALAALAELEKELAAAVAERDGLGDYRSEFEPIWDGLQDALEGERQINNYGLGESEVECVRRVLRERDILRARLAAIDAAPTVAVVCSSECFGAFVQQRFFGSELPNIGTDLIARPAKD